MDDRCDIGGRGRVAVLNILMTNTMNWQIQWTDKPIIIMKMFKWQYLNKKYYYYFIWFKYFNDKYNELTNLCFHYALPHVQGSELLIWLVLNRSHLHCNDMNSLIPPTAALINHKPTINNHQNYYLQSSLFMSFSCISLQSLCSSGISLDSSTFKISQFIDLFRSFP